MHSRCRIQLSIPGNLLGASAILLAATGALAAPRPPNLLPVGPGHWSVPWQVGDTFALLQERAFDGDEGADTLPLNPDEPFDDGRGDNLASLPERSFDADDQGAGPTLPDADAESDTFGVTQTPYAYPNPSFGPVTIELGTADLSVEVYDAAGRRVAHVLGRTGRAVWDGRDELGRLQPSGVYFARVVEDTLLGRTVRIVRR